MNDTIGLKAAFGLENLCFYEKGSKKRGKYHCLYISDPDSKHDTIPTEELEFLLQSLSRQQGVIYFDDYQKTCTGLDELKTLLLTIKLAGLY